MMSVVEAFQLGWRSCRERGAIAKVLNPSLSLHGVFTEMTMSTLEDALAIIQSQAETKTETELKEHPIG